MGYQTGQPKVLGLFGIDVEIAFGEYWRIRSAAKLRHERIAGLVRHWLRPRECSQYQAWCLVLHSPRPRKRSPYQPPRAMHGGV